MYGIQQATQTPHQFPHAVKDTNNGLQTASSHVDDMKNIAKARLRRQVMADPSLARELVSVEASAVYNSRGSLIAALSTRQFTV